MTVREITAADVLALLDLAAVHGVRIWLDGGWAVDACLGEQTRRHDDVDIVVTVDDVDRLVAALRDRGYSDVPSPDTRLWNFVLGDTYGREVDFHVVALDDDGNGVYGPPANDEVYPASGLAGTGAIAGRTVNCLTAEQLVEFHTGYEPDAGDWADVSALCTRFGIPIPDGYARLAGTADDVS
ncbi:MAG TPA: aminoglycoside nucleotidyltransferase [Micromonosporaceae bacterium]